MTRVRAIELRMIGLPLVRPFRTSFGVETEKECFLVRLETDDAEGWGEAVTGPDPGFSEEFNEGAWLVIREFLAPAIFAAGEVSAETIEPVLAGVRGNPMAKAAVINALLDAELRARNRSLASYLGASIDAVACGVSVGITPTAEELLAQVEGYLAEGYRRIKLKIEPGTDVDRVRGFLGGLTRMVMERRFRNEASATLLRLRQRLESGEPGNVGSARARR